MDQKNKNIYIFFFFFLTLMGVLLFIYETQPQHEKPRSHSVKGKKNVVYEEFKRGLREKKSGGTGRRVKNRVISSEKSKNEIQEKQEFKMKHSYLFEEGDFSLLYTDLEENSKDSTLSSSLEEKLNLQILLDQKKKSYDKAYKKAFIKAFIQNAREKGYVIKINKNLDVIEVKKLKPSLEPFNFE